MILKIWKFARNGAVQLEIPPSADAAPLNAIELQFTPEQARKVAERLLEAAAMELEEGCKFFDFRYPEDGWS